MGSLRLAAVFGSGLIGILFLVLALTPLISGKVESRPTTVTIEELEAGGFPDADYLEVTGGHLVFSEANLWLLGRQTGQVKINSLTVPVISSAQLSAWQAAIARNDPVDASRMRLAAVFTGEQVARLWPEFKREALETGEAPDAPPVQLTLVGETEPAHFQITKPMQDGARHTGLDWKKARWLRYERHFNSLGRCLRNILVGVGLLVLAILIFGYHRRRPDDVTVNTLDVTPLFELDD